MIRVLTCSVPLDREWHEVNTVGPVLHAQACGESTVKIWTEDHGVTEGWADRMMVRAYADREPIDGVHVATVITPNEVAWHLYARAL